MNVYKTMKNLTPAIKNKLKRLKLDVLKNENDLLVKNLKKLDNNN